MVLFIELLSYQFASPVRWIETLDLSFEQYKFERFIEIGPSLPLTVWLSAPLKQNTKPEMTRLILFAVSSVLRRVRSYIINLRTNLRQPQNQMYLLRSQLLHPLQLQLRRP
ncbi:hypothetical protein BC827DRAFT_1176172 [Russula dissimulans]|nr:hypothetical protein BC827DRAFT_1176172 [Russula dissimulans]